MVSNTARQRFRVSEHSWRMTIVHNKSSKCGGIDFENTFLLQNISTMREVSKKSRKLLSKIGISVRLMQGNDFGSIGSHGGDLSIILNLYLWVSVLLHIKEMKTRPQRTTVTHFSQLTPNHFRSHPNETALPPRSLQ